MLINLRNALMAGKRLPYDAEVEYLESSGTQYIDTGLNYFADFEIGIKLRTSVPNIALGVTSSLCMERVNASNPVWRLHIGSSLYPSTASITDYHIMSWRNGAFAVDGVTAQTVTNTFASATMTLFGAGGRYYPNMIYACKLWDEQGNLVRDYIPVRKGTVGYLYDRVSGKLFGNAGTGDFVLGQDVVPVEYIESHRTEWIDTGIKLRSTDTIDTRLYINSSSATSWYGILGSRDSDRYLILRCFANNDSLVNALSPNHSFSFTRFSWGNFSFAFGGDYHESATNCYLFTYNNNGTPYIRLPYRFANFSITRDGSKLINLLPVRVGTDATSWEGAMMDVLTRRIYRNAGTGAFSYGNDLQYPIPAE